jgi:excisionase family DNA binding protein
LRGVRASNGRKLRKPVRVTNEHQPDTAAEPLVVTIPEAGRILGISRATIYRLIDAGALQRRKILGRALVTVASIRRVAEEGVDA